MGGPVVLERKNHSLSSARGVVFWWFCCSTLWGFESPLLRHFLRTEMKSRIPKGAWPVGYVSLRQLTNDFLELESIGFQVAKNRSFQIDVTQMHADYMMKRSAFFLQIASLCGEDTEGSEIILDETVMEFSL